MTDNMMVESRAKYCPSTKENDILGFHSVRLCCSNSKALSYFFTMCMGFEEVAYKGLETGSFYTASRVLKNGKCTIVLISVISSTETEFEYKHKQFLNSAIEAIVGQIVSEFASWFPLESKLELEGIILRKYFSEVSNISRYAAGKNQPGLREKKLAKAIANDKIELLVVQDFLLKHGDGILDILFEVKNCAHVFKESTTKGTAISITSPVIQVDSDGYIKSATIGIPGTQVQHTLIELNQYKGAYLPGYKTLKPKGQDVNFSSLQVIDHCVQSFERGEMMKHARFYEKSLGFHEFWTVDEDDVFTSNTSLKSIVMASGNDLVKMPLNEPGENSKFRGQVEEFNDYNGGSGVQHIAFKTDNIIETVSRMKSKGVKFNEMSDDYYKNLKKRMKLDNVKIKESLDKLQKLNILVDYKADLSHPDSEYCAYILQIFTQPFSDRPTLFFEIIQRNHHNGFGKGTFRGLFESIEAQQSLRGTLKKNS